MNALASPPPNLQQRPAMQAQNQGSRPAPQQAPRLSQPRPNLPPGISINNRPRLPPGIQVQRTSSPPALQRGPAGGGQGQPQGGQGQHQQQQAQRIPNLPSSIQIQREPASNATTPKSVPRLPAGISISQGGNSASENKLPKSVSISRTPNSANGSGSDSNSMNRLNKLSGISLVGSGGGEGGSGGTGAPSSGLTITKNGDAAGSNSKPNPLARLSHLNVSISGGNNKSPGASPPATPPSSNSPTPQSSGT